MISKRQVAKNRVIDKGTMIDFDAEGRLLEIETFRTTKTSIDQLQISVSRFQQERIELDRARLTVFSTC